MRLFIRDKQPPLLVPYSDHFRLWIIYDKAVMSGSYYHLDFDGTIDLVTVKEGNIVDMIRMRDAVSSLSRQG